jgi:hypothetical protein
MGRTRQGGAQCPPPVEVIVIVDNNGGSVGADNQCPAPRPQRMARGQHRNSHCWIPSHPLLPHATPSHPPHCCFVVVVVFVIVAVLVEQALPVPCCIPHLLPLPLPSRHHP